MAAGGGGGGGEGDCVGMKVCFGACLGRICFGVCFAAS